MNFWLIFKLKSNFMAKIIFLYTILFFNFFYSIYFCKASLLLDVVILVGIQLSILNKISALFHPRVICYFPYHIRCISIIIYYVCMVSNKLSQNNNEDLCRKKEESIKNELKSFRLKQNI